MIKKIMFLFQKSQNKTVILRFVAKIDLRRVILLELIKCTTFSFVTISRGNTSNCPIAFLIKTIGTGVIHHADSEYEHEKCP